MEDLEVGWLPESQKKQVKLTLLGNNSEFQLEEENWLGKLCSDGNIGCQPERRKQDGNTQLSLPVCFLCSQSTSFWDYCGEN